MFLIFSLLAPVTPAPNWPVPAAGRLNQWIIVFPVGMNSVHDCFPQPSKERLVLQIVVALAKIKISHFNVEPIIIYILVFYKKKNILLPSSGLDEESNAKYNYHHGNNNE